MIVHRLTLLLGAIGLGLVGWPDGRGLALGLLLGVVLVARLERAPRYLPARPLRRSRGRR